MLSAGTCRAYDFNFDLSKEEKMWAVNLGGFAFVTAWGLLFWDYGKNNPHTGGEGWFEADSKEGGADKLGHLYGNYVITHGFSYLYERWGYPKKEAALYGALSSFSLMAYMEFGDSFSDYGFSYEDFVMNTAGSIMGYLVYRYPSISSKVDLRLEYIPKFGQGDIFTDYDNMKFLIALKLDGFKFIKPKYLKYLELHFGYYARGYDDIQSNDSRNIYVAFGINIAKIIYDLSYQKTSRIFNYYQVPYTYVPYKWNLDK